MIRRALAARLAELPNVTVVAPGRVGEVERRPGHVAARLEDGRQVRTRLLIAADGARSKLRQEAGIAAAEFAYGQTGIVATVAHALPHGGVAHEHFLPSGPFAMLPMTDYEGRHRSSIVWTERRELAPSLLALPDGEFATAIERRSRPQPRPHRGSGPALVLSAAPHPCGALCRSPPRPGGRCRPCHPSHRGPGAEPGPARCGGPRRGDRRCIPPRPRHRSL